jgi:hypothetical protein
LIFENSEILGRGGFRWVNNEVKVVTNGQNKSKLDIKINFCSYTLSIVNIKKRNFGFRTKKPVKFERKIV